MAITKAVEAVDAWAEIAQNAMRVGTTVDVSPNYSTVLHIDCALTSEVAHTGTEMLVQISSATADDEFWTDLIKFIGPIGTANKEDITNNPLAAGSTTITVVDTTGYVIDASNPPAWRFLEDATLANSELIYQVSYVAATSITILDGVKREHANTADLYNIAEVYAVEIPMSANRVRVVYNNKYDVDGATVATRCRLTKVTGI